MCHANKIIGKKNGKDEREWSQPPGNSRDGHTTPCRTEQEKTKHCKVNSQRLRRRIVFNEESKGIQKEESSRRGKEEAYEGHCDKIPSA